ncbi:MAG TPA: rhodanese-like domain-containing protein [Micromonosporaceae bacterium]
MTSQLSNVLAISPAPPAEAVRYFSDRLRFETDVSDVHADLAAGTPGLVVIDSRGAQAWHQGRLPGAVHLPTVDIPTRAAAVISQGSTVVTYCWGPGCNGATRAALALARLGYPVKEMIGGYEYWVREGLPVQTDTGLTRQPVDTLTAPREAIACAC